MKMIKTLMKAKKLLGVLALVAITFNGWSAWSKYYLDNSEGQTYAAEQGWKGTIYTSLEEALTNATDIYSTLTVAPGVYQWSGCVTNSSDGITLSASETDPAKTIIEGSGDLNDSTSSDSLVLLYKNSTLRGFTIKNFVSHGVSCVTVGNLENCEVRNCVAKSGYVLELMNSKLTDTEIRDCKSYNKCLSLANTINRQYVNVLVSNNTVEVSADVSSEDLPKVALFETGANAITWRNCRLIDNRVESKSPSAGQNSVCAIGTGATPFFDSLLLRNTAQSVCEPEVAAVLCGVGNLSNCVVVACTLPLSAGAQIYHTIISNCVGQGIFSGYNCSAINSLFVANRQTRLNIQYPNGTAFMGSYYNCTFVDNVNESGNNRGIIAQLGSAYNCVFSGNYPCDIADNANNAKNVLYGTTSVTEANLASKLINCKKETEARKIFNLGDNPDLPYYALRKRSPAIDTGDATLNSKSWPLDLAGTARLVGNELDMGCYEWYPINEGLRIILR